MKKTIYLSFNIRACLLCMLLLCAMLSLLLTSCGKCDHSNGLWVTEVEPTEDECGVEAWYCKNCGETYQKREIPKLEKTAPDDADDPVLEELAMELSEDGSSYTVAGIGTFRGEDLVIPQTYKNLPVVGIKPEAFDECTSIKTLHVPASIKTVSFQAFRDCTALERVVLAQGVQEIDTAAFYGCIALREITIPQSVTTIGLTVFEGCDRLIEVENGVQYVNDWVVGIDEQATDGSITLRANTVGIAKDSLSSPYVTSLVLNDGLKYINASALSSTSITSLAIPSGVQSIKDAMQSSTSLEYLWISDTVTEVGYVHSQALKQILVDENNPAYGAFEGVLYTKDGKTLVQYPSAKEGTTFAIPSGVEQIGELAFYLSDFEEISIPSSVHSIGANAFSHARIKQIAIASHVRSVGNNAFTYCRSLTEVQIGNGVKLGTGVFSYCDRLEILVLPNDLIAIGDYMFKGCTRLFGADRWEIAEGITAIGNNVVDGWSALREVYIPASVTSISRAAFSGCNGLATIYYAGSEAEWNRIIADGGLLLPASVQIVFGS